MNHSHQKFDIRQHVHFDSRGRAICPSCSIDKGDSYRKKNLSLVPGTDGAYKCHRGCSPEQIREALGTPATRTIPANLAQPSTASNSATASARQVELAYRKLFSRNGPARAWLRDRGIPDEAVAHYQLGIEPKRQGKHKLWAISIPIPAGNGQYYRKLRIAQWLSPEQRPANYQPWSQYGAPATVFFTLNPSTATQTYLCEGEWDAIALGWQLRDRSDIAVATFTCGSSNVPPKEVLERLPGQVTIFYDRNDKPLKNGTIPGKAGARKVAAALGERARIAQVPQRPEHSRIHGWDVSDALNAGFTTDDFANAAAKAILPISQQEKVVRASNPLRSRLVSNDTLLDRAPDYTEWLVPNLLTANELFLLAASPRAGKSLLAMTLAHSVASGQKFLDRPVTQGSVLYIRCEDSETKIKEREIAQGWSRGLPVYWLDRFKLSELDQLRDITEDIEPRLIVLDTLSRIRDDGISESSAEMSRCLEPLQEMAEELNCCILLVHHTGKVKLDNADKIDVFETIRGSSAIRAVCRGTWVLAADNNRSFRLCVEHGYGREDLKILLDASTLRWRSLGHWQPAAVNVTQAEQVLAYLNQAGEGTIDDIHAATGLPKRSLYVVLSRLHSEDMVSKAGSRRRIVYKRLVKQLQQLDESLSSSNQDWISDAGESRDVSEPLESQTNSDCLIQSARELEFVSSTADRNSIPYRSRDTASQQVSNNHQKSPHLLDETDLGVRNDFKSQYFSPSQKQPATSQFHRGDLVEFFDGVNWIAAAYTNPIEQLYFSPISKQLEASHLVQIRGGPDSGLPQKVANSSLRRSKLPRQGGCDGES